LNFGIGVAATKAASSAPVAIAEAIAAIPGGLGGGPNCAIPLTTAIAVFRAILAMANNFSFLACLVFIAASCCAAFLRIASFCFA
jgi:hypothetical protein